MLKRFRDLLWLAGKDYRNEWQMSFFSVLALAAVLGPMLILFGLKFGIVSGMLDKLVQNPANREIRNTRSAHFTRAWFAEMARRPDVAFVIPRTRRIAATVQLRSRQASRFVPAELLPTAPGDPLLPAGTPLPSDVNEVVLSDSAARRLNVGAGDVVEASVVRQYRGEKERVHLPLKVLAVAPPAAFARDGGFVTLDLLEAIEDFRDGIRVARFGWVGEPPPATRYYPGFRLYARRLRDVAGLRAALIDAGIEVHTRARDIDIVQSIDRNLTTLFWIVAAIGLVGYTLSLSASLWSHVDRKRRELSILRLVGFRTGDIVRYPMIQAAYTGLLGWALAVAIYAGVASAINHLMAPQMEPGQRVCHLLPGHLLLALLLTLAAAITAAALAGYRAARIEPAEGLREL